MEEKGFIIGNERWKERKMKERRKDGREGVINEEWKKGRKEG